jgi:hypothetical protein
MITSAIIGSKFLLILILGCFTQNIYHNTENILYYCIKCALGLLSIFCLLEEEFIMCIVISSFKDIFTVAECKDILRIGKSDNGTCEQALPLVIE